MYERILAISPHTDDSELGAGGFIARAVKEGATVRILALSHCQDDRLQWEAGEAAEVLGATLRVYTFKNRIFDTQRQAILELLIEARDDFKPDLVLVPAHGDGHQDHGVVTAEAWRAFRVSPCSIWGYMLPWNRRTVSVTGLAVLSELDMESKSAALACYESQQHRAYMRTRVILGQAVTHGVRCGARYAEAFEVIRHVL